jgi:hypothetical protein
MIKYVDYQKELNKKKEEGIELPVFHLFLQEVPSAIANKNFISSVKTKKYKDSIYYVQPYYKPINKIC